MKKTLLIIIALILNISIFAQTPESFKYQAVVRDGSGNVLANQPVGVQISILQGSQTGTNIYSETFTPTTNQYGLINLNIGEGTTSDVFSDINWINGPYFIKLEVDVTGSTNYADLGTSQLKSVPFALLAKDIQNKQILNFSNDTLYLTDGGQVYLGNYTSKWAAHGDDIYNTNVKNVGVGIEDPMGKLVVQGDSAVSDTLPLFEVKNKDGQTIFAVYDGGVRVYVRDDNGMYANNDKGGFAIGGYRLDKSVTNEYMRVTPDSVRIYIKEENTNKANNDKGGFAIGGYRLDKTLPDNYMNIYAADTAYVINPSEARMVWYPLKEAFLTGRVIIESADSVGLNSWATGFESKSIGDFSQAMGYKATARGFNSTSIGDSSVASGLNSYAFGSHVIATDTNTYAFGHESAALAKGSFVLGQGDTASAESAMALGFYNKASGVASLALGAYTQAQDTLSVAMGYKTISSGLTSVAMGDSTQATGIASLALGSSTLASGDHATAMGTETQATGEASIAMGHLSHATSYHSIAMGDSCYATNHDAIAMGYHTKASGIFAVSMGYITLSQGDASFSMGHQTNAFGSSSIAMGSNTIANGNSSLAIGETTVADGQASVALGISTHAQGNGTASFGIGTNATSAGSFVIGSYNEVFSPVNSTDINSDLFVIADGNILTPHNAFTVLKSGYVGINTNTPDKLLTVDGDARITGDIYYGGIGAPTIYDKPDFVFNKNYNKDFDIPSIEKFIKKHKHLPWLTSAKKEKGGINMTRMGFETLEAVENQQMQIISLNKNINAIKKENLKLKANIANIDILKKDNIKQDEEIKMLIKQNKELLKRIEKLENSK